MNVVITILALLLALPSLLNAQEAITDHPKNAITAPAIASENGTVLVSGPEHVQDTMLRNGRYWGKWNYGNAPYLQVGAQPSTVYDVYRSVSLVRFELSGLPAMSVDSAKLRLYIPRNQTQQVPVPIHIHAVSAANATWREGTSEAEEQLAACSWNSPGDGRSWAGAPGLAKPGVDYEAKALDTKIADGLNGEWLEFEIPKALVQSWMNEPDRNAGLLIRTDDNAALGESTHICSSKHWSGKGPQLVVQGKFSATKVAVGARAEKIAVTRLQLPPAGPLFHRWLDDGHAGVDRYPLWDKDETINLTGEQMIYPYLWDIVVKANILIPKGTLPLSKITEEIPAVVARGDKVRARQIMEDCMKYLMVYDYGRDQIWYDSGPTADVLSPLQIARFFVKAEDDGGKKGARGIYSQYDDGRWGKSSPEEIEKEIKTQLAEIKQHLKPDAEQSAAIEKAVRYNLPLEYHYREELKQNLELVQKLIAEENDGVEMLQALRSMFFNHRMFLIHQSLFSMPKYSVLLENGDILGYAQWFYSKRVGQYNHERVGRQLAAATRYMWKPSPYQEAEYADFQGCEWSNELPGFTGTGYVIFKEQPESHVEWETEIAAGGKYCLAFRYSLPGRNDMNFQLAINGIGMDARLAFSPTAPGIWATNLVAVNLPAGSAKIRLTAIKTGGLDLDYLDIQPSPTGRADKSTRGTAAGTEKPALVGSTMAE